MSDREYSKALNIFTNSRHEYMCSCCFWCCFIHLVCILHFGWSFGSLNFLPFVYVIILLLWLRSEGLLNNYPLHHYDISCDCQENSFYCCSPHSTLPLPLYHSHCSLTSPFDWPYSFFWQQAQFKYLHRALRLNSLMVWCFAMVWKYSSPATLLFYNIRFWVTCSSLLQGFSLLPSPSLTVLHLRFCSFWINAPFIEYFSMVHQIIPHLLQVLSGHSIADCHLSFNVVLMKNKYLADGPQMRFTNSHILSSTCCFFCFVFFLVATYCIHQ